MRKLAIFSFSFAAAVFGANYLLADGAVLLSGAFCLVLGLAFALMYRGRRARRGLLRWTLIWFGLALGLLWTALYSRVFFQPARDLDGRTVLFTAVVADWPQEEERGCSVPVRGDTESGTAVSAILYTDGQGAGLRPGDRISTVARCTLGDRTFAGEKITYYTAKGIFLRAQAYGQLNILRPESVPPRYWPALWARVVKRGIDQAFPADVAPLIRALVTGNRDSLTDQFTTSLQRTGLSHTVAVSGMHLAFLAGMVSLVLGRGKRSTALLTILWVMVFCGVAGNTPSVVRAAVMIILLQLAPLLGRERDSATALASALLILLLWNPFSAAHVGLQLSFGAVGGILLVSDRIQDGLLTWLGLDRRRKGRLARWLVKIPRFCVSVLSATLGASVLTVPLVALYFQSFSLIAPLSNLLTLWAVALLFLAGLLLGTLEMALPGLGAVLAIPFTVLARWMMDTVQILGRLPLAAVPLTSVYYRMWIVFLCALVGGALAVKGRKRPVIPLCAGVFTLTASVLLTALSFRCGVLTASVLDVGQGQSVLLGTGDFLTLVDCGGDGPDNAGDVAADRIQALGRGRLDLLVVSHCHADHANGVPQLLRRLDVSVVALPDVEEESPLRREIMDLARARGTEVWLIREDTRIQLEGDRNIVLFPPLGQGTDTNELGLTALISAGDFDVLITGDMGGEVERLLLDHGDLPDIELLVAGHHGSRASTTQGLLDRVRPELAVISVGKNNRYGHPARETLERLAASGAELYRTDLQGTVTVRVGG